MALNKPPCPPTFTARDDFDMHRHPMAPKAPEISVILSTYNRSRREGECESLLKRAIDSILNQTFANFELILIDDCSMDGTKDYCIEISAQDPRIQFFHFKKNSGGIPAKRYNFGISASCGKYIAFMFDDDRWEPNALEDLYQGIEKSYRNYGMVYGLATCYFGSDLQKVETLGGKWGWSKIDTFNFIANNTVIVKKSAIDLVGGYDEDPIFVRVCDWDLWWRIGRKFRVRSINSKISSVYSELSDSIGTIKRLDWNACKKRQRTPRSLPLQVIQKEPLFCKIHSAWFDLYVNLSQKSREFPLTWRIKRILKKILPNGIYMLLKKINTSKE